MKKILILLLITLSLTTYAQKNYSIERPLYLGTVNEGTASDSVLVRGADKIVKFVPRSQFGGGSGGAQDLQSVLNVSGLATKDGGYSGIELFGGESGNRFFRFWASDPNERPFSELTIKNDLVNITNNSLSSGSGYSTELRLDEGVFTVEQYSGEYDSFSLFGFAPPLYEGSVELLLPSKPEGIYTLATTDDIKLKEYTVSTLPAGTKGDVAFVNDAASPSFLATVVGGGSTVVRVFYNGSNWIVQ